jgi:hypothetical protein
VRRICILSLLLAGSLLLPFASAKVPPAQPSQRDIEKNVRKVAEQVCQAVKHLDVDAVMKVADVPWWHNTGNERNRVFTKRDELANWFSRAWGSEISRPAPAESVTLTKIIPYQEERNNISSAKQRMMEQVLTKDDWVIWITSTRKNGGALVAKLFIGQRQGQWKLIGVDE